MIKLTGIAILVLLISMCCVGRTNPTIKIYTEKIITSGFLGNGVQWSAYHHADSPDAEWGLLMTDEKWKMVFSRLDYMKPQMVRVLDQANWRYLKGFDTEGKPVLDFNTPEVKALEKLLGYCQKNNVTVLFGEWGCPYQVHDLDEAKSGRFTGANDPRWIDMIVRYLDHLINVKGYTCLKYYNLVNEPNGSWASTNGNWKEWSEGIRLLKKALDKAGLSGKINIAGPDAVAQYDHPQSVYKGIEWVAESVSQLNDCIGLYDIHAYTTYDMVRSGKFYSYYSEIAKLSKKTNKPFVFGEIGFNKDTPENGVRIKTDRFASDDSQMSVYDFSYGIDMADAAIQIINSGYSGAMAWDLDDAMHTNDDKGDRNQLKRWGFWNSLGTELCNNPDDEKIRPWFYTWSLLCRYFPKGINIIKSDSTEMKGLRLVAGIKEGGMTIAIVNNSVANQKINLKLIGSSSSESFKKFLYSDKLRLVDENNFPVPYQKMILNKSKQGIAVEIPANSLVLFTSFNF